ncbi:MAG: hypothetical protein ACE5EQ_05745 [Phycisphaerae bacterium]
MTDRSGMRRSYLAAGVFVGLAVLHVVLTRLCWARIPLQTDTGMWAYIGGRILDGALIYRDLWESKPPGIYYTFAGVEWLFGGGAVTALVWLDAAVSLAVFVVVFRLARRFASPAAAGGAVLLLSGVFCHRVLADWGDNLEKFVALFEILACVLVTGAIVRREGGGSEFDRRDADGPHLKNNNSNNKNDRRDADGSHLKNNNSNNKNDRRDADAPRATGWTLIRFFTAGLCCGLAALFKQTGIVFLLAATIYLIWERFTRGSGVSVRRSVAAIWAGAAVVWVPVVGWMRAVGVFDEFYQQVVQYDLTRAASGDLERTRLLTWEHWRQVGLHLKLAAALLAPALIAVIGWMITRRQHRTRENVMVDTGFNTCMRLVAGYWVLATLVYLVAPYGYGHYLLQAAPAAAVLVAWGIDRAAAGAIGRPWAVAGAAAMLVGLVPQGDHFRFTIRGDTPNRAYAAQRGRMDRLVALLEEHTRPEQSVMLWDPDYAASFAARRRTPLECSNSDVIFKGKINRLSPSMDALIARLDADPPDVIVDRTPARASREADGEPVLLATRAGFSLLETPDDGHPMREGRMLAPLKRWVRLHYGGQERIGGCTFFYRGRAWRNWREVLLPDG